MRLNHNVEVTNGVKVRVEIGEGSLCFSIVGLKKKQN